MEGEDYRAFELPPRSDGWSPHGCRCLPTTKRAPSGCCATCVCVSLHEHGGIAPLDWDDNEAYIRQGREWYGFEGLAASGLDAVFENFLDGTATITSANGWKWTDVIHDLGMHLADVAHQSDVFLASTVADIERAHETGQDRADRRASRARRRSRTSSTGSTCCTGSGCG